MKKLGVMWLFILGIFLVSCGNDTKKSEISVKEEFDYKTAINEQLAPPLTGDTVAIMDTSMGTVKIKLFPELTQKAVENFTTHAQDGYYDNLIFHRVMEEFMIQGGDPLGTGNGGESIWGTPFADEFTENLHNFRGALSMANSGPNTNGSQFFIVQAKEVGEDLAAQLRRYSFSEDVIRKYQEIGGTPWLDKLFFSKHIQEAARLQQEPRLLNAHTIFGQVYEGMDVVDAIAAVETGVDEEGNPNNKPVKDVLIKSIKIEVME